MGSCFFKIQLTTYDYPHGQTRNSAVNSRRHHRNADA